MQTIKMTFAIAAVGFAVLAGGHAPAEAAPLSAAPLASMSRQLADQPSGGALQKAHYRKGFCWQHPHNWRCRHARPHRHCRNWRWRCADRWGWHTPRYRQCLRRHGC